MSFFCRERRAIRSGKRVRGPWLTSGPLWLLTCLPVTILMAGDPIQIADPQREDKVSFAKEIAPILQKNCLACHSASEKQGNLVLETPQGILAGGDTGPAAVPGRGSESLMVKLAAHQEDPVMPPEGNDVSAINLTPAELGLLKRWIDEGAGGKSGIDSLSPKQWQPLPSGVHPVQAVALTEDGQYLACSRANQIFLYHVPTGQLITKLTDPSLDTEHTTGIAHRDMVQSLAFNLDGDLLASGGFREVKLWRRPRDVQRKQLPLGAEAVAMTVSPNRQWIAVSGNDHAIRVFRAADGELAHTLAGHKDAVVALRFSADSAKLVSGSLDHHAGVWNVAQGQLSGMIETPSPVTAVELVSRELPSEENPAPQQWLVTGSSDKTIRTWELPGEGPPSPADSQEDAESLGKPIGQMTGHTQPVTALVADPLQARQFYSGSLDGTIRLWNIDNGRVIRQINHGGPVMDVAVSPDGNRIASAGENKIARLFRSSGQSIAQMRGDVRLGVSVTRAEQGLTSAKARQVIAKRLLDEAEKDLPKKEEAEKKLAEALAAANKEVNEKQAAVDKSMAEKLAAEKAAIEASTSAKSALAEKEQAQRLADEADTAAKVAQGRMGQLQRALAANPDNERLKQLVATAQQELETCQKISQTLTSAIKAPTTKAQEMASLANSAAQKVNDVQKPYNEATAALKTAQDNQNLLAQQHALAAKELKDAQDLVPKRKEFLDRAAANQTQAEESVAAAKETLAASEQPIRSIAFSPDGSTLVTGGDFDRFHTWDGNTGEAIAAFAGHEKSPSDVTFLDDQTILSASPDQSCRFWELNPKWKLERVIGSSDQPDLIAHRATAVDFNRQSTQVLVAGGVPSRSGELQVFRVADGSRLLHLPKAHDDVIYAARFSPDGKRIASGGADKYLRTFDVNSGNQLRRFEGHTNYVLGVAWKSDGETIATSSADHTIKFWEAETADQRRTITQQLSKHVTAVEFIGDTNNVVSSSGDKRVRMHNGTNGAILRNFSSVKSWLHCVAVTPDGGIVTAGEAGGNVSVWNGTNGQVLHTLTIE